VPSALSVVEACEFPSQSVLHPGYVGRAYFHDSYRVSSARKDSSLVEIFFGIFAHHPTWMKVALVARNCLASAVGLEAPSKSEIMTPEIRSSYSIGDKIGPWPIFALSENELVAGRNNGHLDFRLSILRAIDGENEAVVVSTVCLVHNTFGKVYLFFIVPFHKWGVRSLMEAAAVAGRL
jgi:hypothetical protein